MFSEFNSTSYFINLLAISIVLIPIYRLFPWALAKRIIFIIVGCYLLYLIAPRLAILYILFWTSIFLLQNIIVYFSKSKHANLILWLGLCILISPMILWKLWYIEFSTSFNLWGNFLTQIISTRLNEIDFARSIIIPIGLSFATFRGIDLLVKSYIGRFKALSLDRVFFYGFFPPVQVVGPIIEYDEIEKQGELFRAPSSSEIYSGLIRISFGLIKVIILANILSQSSSIFYNYDDVGPQFIWITLFIYMWFFYLNFSGYSDLAIGVSLLFGFKLKENFNFPYFSTNISDFWNRWHMSLSRFAQRNAFIPLGGYRKQNQYFAIFATIMVIALWHDLTLGMILFGIYHGLGLITHRLISDRMVQNNIYCSPLMNWLKISGTYTFVALSFPLLVLPLNQASYFYLALFGISS